MLSAKSIISIVFLGFFVFGLIHSSDYNENSLECAYKNNDFRLNKEIFHWQDNGLCCTHVLNEYNKAVVSCGE